MPRNGLTKEKLVEAAAEIIESRGAADFSMRALAEKVNVKTASLYNHVESMDALMTAVCAYALELQRSEELAAIEGKSGADAIFALAEAYRRFAREHRELYRLILSMAASGGEQLSGASECIAGPFLRVLEDTALTQTERYHWQRVLRAIVHGFVSQEDAGFFSHLSAQLEESFRTALRCYIDGLAQAEKRGRA